MRYAWDLHDSYLKSAGLNKGLKGYIVRRILSYMRKWDLKSASNVDYFIANSNYVAERIKKIYNRSSHVIYPPVNTDYFQMHEQKEDFYLTIARMVSYKKVDLIVETFNQFPDKKLVVIGSGPDLSKIQKLANKNIEVLGYQTEEVLRNYLQKAKAFVFAADEDFGITSIEAQACGTPVLAYRKGGNLETVVENKTGLFFDEQTVQSLKDCILQFEKQTSHFSPLTIREHAEKFSEERFRRNIKEFISEKYSQFLLEQQTIGRKKEKTS
jgi:glycosyltransferase involved in cell wall biosynthesis